MRTTKKLPKRNNATSGKKAHNDNNYYKVGRIKMNSWAAEVLPVLDIICYESELVHISKDHHKELAIIGMTAFDFVKYICSNFNELRKGTGNSVLLAVNRPRVSNVAAVEICKEEKNNKDVYKIKTATLMNTRQLCLKKLLKANDH